MNLHRICNKDRVSLYRDNDNIIRGLVETVFVHDKVILRLLNCN